VIVNGDSGVATLSSGAPLSTDDYNRLATRSPRVLGAPLSLRALDATLLPLLEPRSVVSVRGNSGLDLAYLATRRATTNGPTSAAFFYASQLRALLGYEASEMLKLLNKFATDPCVDPDRFREVVGQLEAIRSN
jgi:hypothetical protein